MQLLNIPVKGLASKEESMAISIDLLKIMSLMFFYLPSSLLCIRSDGRHMGKGLINCFSTVGHAYE